MMKKIIFIFVMLACHTLMAQPRSLSLQDCLNLAISQSKSLQIKQEETKIAGYKQKEAQANYFPKINSTFTYLHMSDEAYLLSEDKYLPIGTKMTDGSFGFRSDQVYNQFTIINGTPVPLDGNGEPFNPKTNPEKIQWKDYTIIPRDELAVDMRNTFIGAVSVVQPVYMGGRIVNANKMAKIGVDIAQQMEESEKSELFYNVENAYWTVISLLNKVKTIEEYQKLLTKLASDVTELNNEGMAVKGDILKVRVKLNEVNMNLARATNGLNLAKMQLCQYVGLPTNTDINLTDNINGMADMQMTGNLSETFNNRTEIKILEKLTELNAIKAKIAFAGYLPEIGVMGNLILSNPDFFNGFQKEFSGTWNIGVTMKIPLVNLGETRQKVKAANSERNITELKLAEAHDKIELQASQASYKVDETGKKLQAAISNLEQAGENLRYAQTSFEEGLAGITDVLDAQAARFAAHSDKEDAEIELKLNKLYLKKTMGLLK